MKDAPGAHDTLMGRREVIETANGAMRACRAWEFLEHAGMRSSRERMELRLGKERQPVLTIVREKTGALRFQIHTPELPPPPITTPLEKALLHAELPDPESPYWVPGDIQRLLRECLAAALKHAISQDAGGMLPNPESLNHEIIMEEVGDRLMDSDNGRRRVSRITREANAGLRALMDAGILQRVRALTHPPTTAPDEHHRSITAWHYNAAANLGPRLEDLVKTNPGAAAWVLRSSLRREDIYHPGQVIRIARESLNRLGLTPGAWKFAARLSPRTIWAITSSSDDGLAVRMMNLLAEAGAEPGEETVRWARGLLARSQRYPGDAIGPNSMQAIKLALREAAENPTESERIQRETRDILDFTREMDRGNTPLHSRSLPGLRRRSDEWRRQVREGVKGRTEPPPLEWESLIGVQEAGGCRVVPLTSQAGLQQETNAMQHCVTAYGARCASGTSRIFSIQRGGERVATMEIVLQGDRWELGQVRGSRNAQASEEAQEAARKTREKYNQAWSRTSQKEKT